MKNINWPERDYHLGLIAYAASFKPLQTVIDENHTQQLIRLMKIFLNFIDLLGSEYPSLNYN